MASNKLDAHQTAVRRKIIGSGLAAVLAVALIAIVVVRSSGDKLLNENGDTLVLVGQNTEAETATIARGKLSDVGGCLGLIDEGTAAIIIWPHGTTVATPDPLRVKVGSKTHKLGDTVELNGGFSDPLDGASSFYDLVPDGCRTSATFVMSAR